MKQEIQVKGVSRRVVIVPTDEESVFEEVICIVKEDAETVSAEAILRQAEEELYQTVEEEENTPRFLGILPALMLLLLTVLVGVLAWCFFFGV